MRFQCHFYVFEGRFDGEFTKLTVPGSVGQSVTGALFEHRKDQIDDRPTVVDIDVEPGVMRSIKAIELPVLDDWAVVFSLSSSRRSATSKPLSAVICRIRSRFLFSNCQPFWVSCGRLAEQCKSRMVLD